MIKIIIVVFIPVFATSYIAKTLYEYRLPSELTYKYMNQIVYETRTEELNRNLLASENNRSDKIDFSIAVLSDSHDQLDQLKIALDISKDKKASVIVYLGDYTDWGDMESLKKSKDIMDAQDLPYYSIPGDHDLGQTRDSSNFIDQFGQAKGTFEVEEYKFLYFDNSYNFTPIDDNNMKWLQDNLEGAYAIFLSQPLLTSSMSRVMGIIEGVKNEEVYSQNEKILQNIRNSSVKVIISGDLHEYSRYKDTKKPGLVHITNGALLKSEGLEKINLQAPRMGLFHMHKDGSWSYEDLPLENQ